MTDSDRNDMPDAASRSDAESPFRAKTLRRRLLKVVKFGVIAAILYVASFAVLDHFGSYKLYHDDDGVVYWVWRGAFMWHKDEGEMLGRAQHPSVLGVLYLPLTIAEWRYLNRHPTLMASAPRGDGVQYEYPELGLTWDNARTSTVTIPGKTPQQAADNYQEHLDSQ